MNAKLTKEEKVLLAAYEKANKAFRKHLVLSQAYNIIFEKMVKACKGSKKKKEMIDRLLSVVSCLSKTKVDENGKMITSQEVVPFYAWLDLSSAKEKEDESIITATTFQLKHVPLFKSSFDVGDRVESPLGVGHIRSLNKETGDCTIKLEKMV